MTSNKIGYIWCPLFFLFGVYELFVSNSLMHMMMGHSSSITGQMWFMWLMMSLAASSRYIDIIETKLWLMKRQIWLKKHGVRSK